MRIPFFPNQYLMRNLFFWLTKWADEIRIQLSWMFEISVFAHFSRKTHLRILEREHRSATCRQPHITTVLAIPKEVQFKNTHIAQILNAWNIFIYRWMVNFYLKSLSRWWFLKHFLYSPRKIGEDVHPIWGSYFSGGVGCKTTKLVIESTTNPGTFVNRENLCRDGDLQPTALMAKSRSRLGSPRWWIFFHIVNLSRCPEL